MSMPTITLSAFLLVLTGRTWHARAIRQRYVVAAALRRRARERRDEGRADIAGRLAWAAMRVEAGFSVPKHVRTHLTHDLKVIQLRLCTPQRRREQAWPWRINEPH